MRKLVFFLIVLAGLAVHLFYEISQSLETNRNDVSISMNDPDVEPASLSIAVVGDIHLPEGREPLNKLRKLLLEVKLLSLTSLYLLEITYLIQTASSYPFTVKISSML